YLPLPALRSRWPMRGPGRVSLDMRPATSESLRELQPSQEPLGGGESRERQRPSRREGPLGEIARSSQLPGWWIRAYASTAMIFSDDVFQISRVGDCSEQSTRKLPSPELLLRLTPAFRKNVVSVSESASVSQESTAAPEPLSAVTMYRVHFQS